MSDAKNAVTKRAGIVSAGTLLSRILGLVRESVIAAYFPKETIDAYQVAFMIPNSFRRLTAEGSFSISVTSVFSKIWAEDDIDRSRAFVRSALGFSLIFLLVLTATGVFGAKWFASAAGWGFKEDPHKFAMAVSLTRIMFPYILFISLTALAMGILNSAGRFFAPAFAPVLLNVSIIGCAVGLAGFMPNLGVDPIFAMAVGVIIGGIAQALLQLPSLRAIGLLVLPSLNILNRDLRRVLKMTLPMLIGAAAYQIGLFISTAFASTMGTGAVTYIQFANRLMELPLAVLVMAISTAALPSMAALKGEGKLDEMKIIFGHALRLALFVATPAMIALVVLAEPVITILYQRGLFTHDDVLKTAAALRLLALGICFVALLRQTVPVFYSLEKVKIPVIMTMVNIVVYISTALLLMKPFGYLGLCVAVSLAASVQALGLIIILRKLIGPLSLQKTFLNWLRMLSACVPMAAAVYAVSLLGRWEIGGNSALNIGVLALAVLTGIVMYFIFAYIVRVPEMKELLGAVRARSIR